MLKVYFASDHAGFMLKGALLARARSLGYETEDLGAFSLDPGDDYPNFVTPCARKVAEENTHAPGSAYGMRAGEKLTELLNASGVTWRV